VPEKEPATQVVKNIRRATRRHFASNLTRFLRCAGISSPKNTPAEIVDKLRSTMLSPIPKIERPTNQYGRRSLMEA